MDFEITIIVQYFVDNFAWSMEPIGCLSSKEGSTLDHHRPGFLRRGHRVRCQNLLWITAGDFVIGNDFEICSF